MIKYIIEENDEEYYDVDAVIDACIDEDWHDDDDYFEEWVNNEYGSIYINGETFYAYDIVDSLSSSNLNELNERFCEAMNDNDREDARCALLNSRPGDTVDIQNYTVRLEYYENGDEDGDEYIDGSDRIETLRAFINDQKAAEEQKKAEDKKNEDDFMKLFQTVGV